MKNDLQKDWLKINRMCQDLRWLTYNSDNPECAELKKILEQLTTVKNRMKELIEGL